MKRRLGLVIFLALALVQAALPLANGAATDNGPAETQAGEWAADADLAAQTTAGYHQFKTDFPANALMIHWTRAGVPEDMAAEAQVSQDGRNWSEWIYAPVDEDSDGPYPSEERYTGAVMIDPSRFVRVRGVNALGQPVPALPGLKVTYLNTLAGPESDSVAPVAGPGELAAAESPPAIISRKAWGANESYRFRNGKERWPREYQAPEKVILHHTETPNNQDPMAAIRAVYYFHAVTKGWGDIGYNYLVDQQGRVYEGRAGGDFVIAGHALQYNRGSIGISMLGSYQATRITEKAEESIVRLIASKASFIDPIGQTWFVDKVLPNIMGHRDCLRTACPGNAFYSQLPDIRDKVLQRIGHRPTLDATISEVQMGPVNLKTGDQLKIQVTVTNTGSAIMPSDAQGPNMVYVDTQDFNSRGMPKVTGKFRVALGAEGVGGVPYPFRWGLGKPLLPGESATVVGYVRMTRPQDHTFTVALVQEYVKYWQRDLAPTRVVVAGPQVDVEAPPPLDTSNPPGEEERGALPTDPEAQPVEADPNRTYFPETGHYLGFGFRYYWEHNGGLAQFGFPLTGEFREVNPADGQEYTVQYFERARFEYHPEHQGTQFEVLLGLLGNQTVQGRGFTKGSPNERPAGEGRFFPETGQWLSGSFLKYWNEHGGLMMYGYPISPAFEEVNPDDGKTYTVQYFERNRFEYHPEYKGTPNEVLLGLLGRQALVDRGWLERAAPQ